MPPAERHPVLTAADSWADGHRELLAACFERFAADLVWPTLEELQRAFELAGRDVDVAATAWKMPGVLGFVDGAQLVLLVRGLSHVSAADRLLEDWCAALRLAYQRWCEDPSARLTYMVVVDLFGGDSRRADAVSVLLTRERWPFGSGEGGPRGWSYEITSGVRTARSADHAADVITARDAIEFPAAAAQERAVSADQPVRPISAAVADAWRIVSHHPLWSSFLAAVLAGFVLLGVNNLGGSGLRPGAATVESPPSPSQPAPSGSIVRATRHEQAGAGGARTFANAFTLSSPGPDLTANEQVRVICKVYAPTPPSVVPNGYWYRLASKPWSGRYFAPANSFWNGDIPGKRPYTHNTDFKVPNCASRSG
jgi:hypothetical protein